MRRRALLLFFATSVCLSTASPAAAAPGRAGSGQEQQDRTLRDQVTEASAEEVAVLGQLDEAEGRRRQLDSRIGELDRQLAGVQSEARAAEARLEVVQSDFVRTQMELRDARGGLASAREEVRMQAVSAYLGNPSASAAESLLRSGNLRELATTSSYLETVAQARLEVVDRFRAVRDSTESLQVTVEARKDDAKAQRDVVIARQSALEGVRSELGSIRGQAAGEEANHQALLNGVRARVNEFEGQIAVLQGESNSVTGLLQAAQSGRPLPVLTGPSGSGRLRPPVSGALSSMFGPRVHPIFGTVRMHNGVDSHLRDRSHAQRRGLPWCHGHAHHRRW